MTATAINRPSATRAIPVRRLDVDLGTSDLPRWIVDDDPVFSHFVATLSAVFPRGEEFFVAAVRRHRNAAADDPILAQQVKAFIGQEAMHGREHRAFNRSLDARGYRTHRAERGIGRVLDRVDRLRPTTLPLAVTAAAEHLTGIFAEAVLGDPETMTTLFDPDDIRSLISWHALEELEHKNVAFDVFERADGRYWVRLVGMGVTMTALAGYVGVAWVGNLVRDGRRIGPRRVRNFRRNLKRQRLLSPWSARQLGRYLRRGFHPDDMDTDGLVDEWRGRLADRTTTTAGMKVPEPVSA